jgi:CRP-like cAMP-binding protein
MLMPPAGEEVELLRRMAMFAPLPLAVIELLAADLEPHEFAPGTAAVREGESGDLIYLIVAGSATVNVGESPGRRSAPATVSGRSRCSVTFRE